MELKFELTFSALSLCLPVPKWTPFHCLINADNEKQVILHRISSIEIAVGAKSLQYSRERYRPGEAADLLPPKYLCNMT